MSVAKPHCSGLSASDTGFADYARSEPYRENTLTLMLSCTKVISAICVAMLVDRCVSQLMQEIAGSVCVWCVCV